MGGALAMAAAAALPGALLRLFALDGASARKASRLSARRGEDPKKGGKPDGAQTPPTPSTADWRTLADLCPAVERVDVPECSLTSIAGIAALPRLKHVDAKGNKMSAVELAASEKRKKKGAATLRVLDLSSNALQGAVDVANEEPVLNNLAALVVGHNAIAQLEGLRVACPTLETLVVSHNELEAIPDLATASLKKLSASYNRIACLPFKTSTPFPALGELRLSHNLVAKLPKDMGTACPALVLLELAHNRVASWGDVSDALKGMRRLQRVSLQGNPMAEDAEAYPSRLLAACPSVTHVDNSPVEGRAKEHVRGKEWVEKQRAAGVVPPLSRKLKQTAMAEDGSKRMGRADEAKPATPRAHSDAKMAEEAPQARHDKKRPLEDPAVTRAASSLEPKKPKKKAKNDGGIKVTSIQRARKGDAATGRAALRAALQSGGVEGW